MRILRAGSLVVEAYESIVWKQERNVLHVVDSNATVASLYAPTQNDKLAEYTLDANKSVIIDMTDYIRANPWMGNVYIRTNGGASNIVNANYHIVGLINPANLIIPHNETLDKIFAFDDEYEGVLRGSLFILPPYRMLSGIDGVGLTFEMDELNERAMQDYELYVSEFVNGAWLYADVDERSTRLSPGVTKYLFGENYIGSTLFARQIHPLDCDKEYAAVRWVSATGVTRCHTWEVVNRRTETDGAFELMTQDGSFNVVKGRKDGFALRLDGLNTYDTWYYSDICHSSKVEVTFDGVTWQRVSVTTKGVVLQDGDAGKMNTLTVELIYREYDAVSM